jgi:beta-phosphoglucomutase
VYLAILQNTGGEMRQNTTIEATIFDMDGVITDTEPLHKLADKQVCEDYGISVPVHQWDNFKGTASRDMFAFILKTFTNGTLPLSVEELVQAKRKRYLEMAQKEMTLIPGALDFIHYARSRVPLMGLVTSSGREIVDLVFNAYGLEPFFNTVVTGDDITHGKPHPEPYLLALTNLQVYPKSVFVIEDSTNGVLSAKCAGCNVIGITTSFQKELLEKAGADRIIDSFSELYDVFS